MTRVAQSEKRAEWIGRLQRFEAAGVSGAEFCRREGIAPPVFYSWRRRLRCDQTVAPPAATGFVAVRIAPPARGAANQSTLVRLGRDVQIELGSDLAVVEVVVQQLLRVVGERTESARGETC